MLRPGARVAAVASLVALAATARLALAPVHAAPSAASCGAYRAVVRTLQDRPRLLAPRATTVARLLRLPRPQIVGARRLPLERQVFSLVARVGVRRGPAGVRLLLRSDGGSIVAEVPPPACTRYAAAARRRQIARARRAARACRRARVVGVAFWGPSGAAANGIELSPVLRFRCARAGRRPPPPPVAEPRAIAGRGYHQVFRDDFHRLNRRVWDDHIWYDRRPSAAWRGFQQVDARGILHLRTSRGFSCGAGCRWPINTITTLSSGRTWTHGYFEARMKWTAGAGAWPGFWLLSYRHATNPAWPGINPYCAGHGLARALCWAAELDVFEGQGTEPRRYYGTLHRNSSGAYGVRDSQNPNNSREVAANLGSAFHTYGVLWTASRVTWYLDGRPLLSAPVYDSTNQPMFLLLQMWVGGWTSDPRPSTPDVLETQVDYVSVWQR